MDMEKGAFRMEMRLLCGFAKYKKSGYSKKYLDAHEPEILIHRNAKKVFDRLGLKKLPKVKNLNQEYREILEKKKTAYAKFKAARSEMKEVLVAKSNVDQILQKEGKLKNDKTRNH